MDKIKLTNLELASDKLRSATDIINKHDAKQLELKSALDATLRDIVTNSDLNFDKVDCTYEVSPDMNWIYFYMGVITLKIIPNVWLDPSARCDFLYSVNQCLALPIAEDLTNCNTLIELVSNSDISEIVLAYKQCVNDPEYLDALNKIDRLYKSYINNARKSELKRLSYVLDHHTGIGVFVNKQCSQLSGYAFILYRNSMDICFKFVPIQMTKNILNIHTQSELKTIQSILENIRVSTLDINEFIETIYLENECAKLYTLPDDLSID